MAIHPWRLLLLPGLLVMTLLSVQAEPSGDGLVPLEIEAFGTPQQSIPLDQRVNRLEGVYSEPHPGDASMDYRLSRLYAIQQAEAVRGNIQEAIDAYNAGNDLASQGKTREAIASYEEAIRLDQTLLPAYNNLGHLWDQMQEYDKAIGTYQQALTVDPNNALIHRNIAVVFEKVGRYQDAMAAYDRYIHLNPNPEPQIVSMVESYQQQKRSGVHATNYLAALNAGGHPRDLLWPEAINPIPVFIQVSEPQQARFLPMVHEALNTWEEATNHRLRFRELPLPEQARIFIQLNSGPLSHPFHSVGHAQYNVQQDPSRQKSSLRVNLTINTGEADDPTPSPYRMQQIRRLALHELGHALGIWGHSTDPGDIMYTQPIADQLSARDTETIQRLYRVYPDKTVKVTPEKKRAGAAPTRFQILR
ncbi:MAG: tetratricopeptide repeat protein [Candidatus Melainabacteria bacterium]